MNIGFALITSNPFFREFTNVENEVHEICGFHNKLEQINNIPHTTLFQGTFENNTDYVTIVNSIRDFFLSNAKDFELHFQKAVYIPQGWYFYTCAITDELQMLHEYTLKQCKEHIILSEDRLNRNLEDLTKAQVEGIKNYGYRYSEKAFFPHITIGRTDGDKNEEYLELLNLKLSKLPKNVPIEKITVYRMGKDGMHAETLAEVYI
jgi:hypothetical protein